MTASRRETALTLAEELLADIELSRIPATEIVKKASRLARLLDDVEAIEWLRFEISGYPSGGLDQAAATAANRSNRSAAPDAETGAAHWWTTTLSRLQADVDGATLQLQSAVDGSVSISSANPNQYVTAPSGNMAERMALRRLLSERQELLGKIVGAVHGYVAEREIELRFGAAVENAFAAVRAVVDAQIAALVPGAAVKLAAAFESASSDNPEHWANAASECRRLLKAIADELRPPGPTTGGREMTDDKYINRLVDWISTREGVGGTLRDVTVADLEDFGRRIDAFDDAGHKGAHSEVTRYEASRFITGVYLLLGDVLALAPIGIREPAPEPDVADPDTPQPLQSI